MTANEVLIVLLRIASVAVIVGLWFLLTVGAVAAVQFLLSVELL